MDHKEFVKKENELCFLPKKQKIKSQGFIFLELFSLNQFDKLKDDIKNIYSNARQLTQDRLEIDKILNKNRKSFSGWSFTHLPIIADNSLKGKILPDVAYFNLPNNVKFIEMQISRILPSFIVMKFQVTFEDKFSEKINEPIYKYHKEIKEKIESPNGNYEKINGPQQQKTVEIENLKKKIKTEVYEFISSLIKGYFLNKINLESIEIVPSINIYSINFPKNVEENNFLIKNSNFFQCFGLNNFISFKYNEYSFLYEQNKDKNFTNYAILVNENKPLSNMHESKKSEIFGTLSFISFDIFTIGRFIEYQEREIIRINSKFSELNFIDKNLKESIEFREGVISKIFLFEGFSREFANYTLVPDHPPFISQDGENLFESNLAGIKKEINMLEDQISKITKQSEIFVGLKNIKYNYKAQNWMLILTLAVLGLTVISIIMSLLIKPEIILKIIFGG